MVWGGNYMTTLQQILRPNVIVPNYFVSVWSFSASAINLKIRDYMWKQNMTNSHIRKQENCVPLFALSKILHLTKMFGFFFSNPHYLTRATKPAKSYRLSTHDVKKGCSMGHQNQFWNISLIWICAGHHWEEMNCFKIGSNTHVEHSGRWFL